MLSEYHPHSGVDTTTMFIDHRSSEFSCLKSRFTILLRQIASWHLWSNLRCGAHEAVVIRVDFGDHLGDVVGVE
jgi:hypothetical protein